MLATSIDDERVDGHDQGHWHRVDGRGNACRPGLRRRRASRPTKETTVDETHFLGCVAFFPEKYADYMMSIAADVLAGTPVPQEVHIEHQFLDRSNIATFYP